MRTANRDTVREWLTAESSGRTDDADRAFSGVAAALPRLHPSRRFAAGVMARVAAVQPPAFFSLWASWWVRSAVAASLTLLGAVAGTLSWKSALLAAISTSEMLGRGFGQAMSGTRVWIEAAMTVWAGVAHAGVVFGRLLVTPGPALLVTVNLAVAVCALAALQRLLATQEKR